MMKILLMPNIDKKNAINCTIEVAEILDNLHAEVLMDTRFKTLFGMKKIVFDDFFKQLAVCDIIITIGGDGTIIHSSKHACSQNKPLLGINLGRLGFMASLEFDELHKLKRLFNNDYKLDKRMMLDVELRTKSGTKKYLALNDVVVTNGSISRIIDLNVTCFGKNVGSYRADGIIVATPTGCTAYTLSAGGPIVEPSVNCIALTPICPHSLFSRSTIFSDEKILNIKISNDTDNEVYITVDGEYTVKFEPEDELIVKKSESYIQLINMNELAFYEVINNKFLGRLNQK
ncbi:MAG: ATP-NAD/AcoX kinase [Oscillospiraceae bacterium]|jgi:NAD+ kinase|nr:ATP-NAD/AcoX kinase [Oscillospiraceae bacterium]